MKIERALRTERGMILIVCLIMIVILAGVASAFIGSGVTTSNHRQASLRRARALYVAESGVSRAVADLNAGGDGMFGEEGNVISFGGGTYTVTTTDNGNGTFTVLSVGQIKEQKRAIEGVVTPVEFVRFSKAMVGNLTVSAGGSAFVDSYDSDAGTYASQAVNVNAETGHTYAKANGNVAANQDILLSGSSTIMGNVTPGPGHSVSAEGGNVYVDGSTAPAEEVEPVQEVLYEPTVSSTGDLGVSSDVTLSDGVYRYDSLTVKNKKTLTLSGTVTLFVDGDIDIKGTILVAEGARVEVYNNNPTFRLNGNGVVNESQEPDAIRFFLTATDMTLNGTSGFYGAIYAPDAAAKINGTNEFFGAVVAKTINVSGTADFHFDEALLRSKEELGLTLSSWRRVPAP